MSGKSGMSGMSGSSITFTSYLENLAKVAFNVSAARPRIFSKAITENFTLDLISTIV